MRTPFEDVWCLIDATGAMGPRAAWPLAPASREDVVVLVMVTGPADAPCPIALPTQLAMSELEALSASAAELIRSHSSGRVDVSATRITGAPISVGHVPLGLRIEVECDPRAERLGFVLEAFERVAEVQLLIGGRVTLLPGESSALVLSAGGAPDGSTLELSGAWPTDDLPVAGSLTWVFRAAE